MGFGKELFENTVNSAAESASSGLAGAGVNLLTNLFKPSRKELAAEQLKNQADLTRLQFGFNNTLMENSFEKQLELWNATNAEAQVAHLKAAGLNPALMYAKGGPGGSTGSGGASVGGGTASDAASLQNAETNKMMAGMAMQKMASEIAVNKSVANKNNADATKTSGIDTIVAGTTNEKLQAEIMNVKQTVKNQEAQEYLTKLQSIQQEFQNEITSATKETAIDIYKQNLSNALATYDEIYSKISKNEAETESINKLRDAQLQDIISSYTLKNANVALTESAKREINAKIALMWPSYDVELRKANASEEQAKAAMEHIQNEINRLDFDKNALGVNTISGIVQSFGQALLVGLMMRTAKGKTVISKSGNVTTIEKSGIK